MNKKATKLFIYLKGSLEKVELGQKVSISLIDGDITASVIGKTKKERI